MNNDSTPSNSYATDFRGNTIGLMIGTMISLMIMAAQLEAQSVIMRSAPLRFTVPVGAEATNTSTLTVTASDATNDFDLFVTGVPAGASATLSTNYLTNATSYTVTLTLTKDLTLSSGVYDMAVIVTNTSLGGPGYRLPVPIDCAFIWSGVNYTNAVSTNFASGGNWTGGAAPNAAGRVVFKNGGGQDAVRTNIIVNADAEVDSIRFAPDANGNRFQTMEIQSGATLKASGPGLSFGIVRDFKNNSGLSPNVQIYGGGALKVTNDNAHIGVFCDNFSSGNGGILDLRNLNNFEANVVRVSLGDYRQYPNYYTNGSVGYGNQGADEAQFPSRFTHGVWLARTNVITCSWVDPNNYDDPAFHEYAISTVQNERNGTTSNIRFTLGLSNAFFIDSICYSGYGAQGGANPYNFNAAGSYALFRGIGGMNSRISVWALADAAGPGPGGTTTRGNTVDFGNGKVDALVDRLYLGRYRTNITASTIAAQLTIGGASPGNVFDVNTAILGYQDVVNLNDGNTSANGPDGVWIVNSNATVRINRTLHLGYTVASAVGVPNFPESTSGVLTVNAGSTVMTSNILVGGVTKLSAGNNINLNTGSTLIVSNGIGSPDKKLSTLSMSGVSRLVLHADGALSDPYVYVTNLTTSGTSNLLRLATVVGLTSDPQTLKLIAYDSASPNFSLELPSGLYGYLENDTINKTINAVVTTVPPKNTVWNGNVNGNWNNSTPNWLGGLVFLPGDSATLDDSATGTRTITVVGNQAIGSGGVTVSNAGAPYSLSSGTISGTSSMTKNGTGSLTMDCTSQLPISIQAGSVTVTGSGTVGLATVASGGSLTSAGSVNGIVTAGTTANSGTVAANGVNVTGGTFVNSGTVNGPLNVTTGSATNATNGVVQNIGISTIAAGATLVNNGVINAAGSGNNRVTVNGLITGTGTVDDPDGFNAGVDGRLAVSGTISPGNSGIGTFVVEGRFDLNQNANMVIEVNKDDGTHDKVNCDYWGAIRGNIVMTNIGTTPFAVGDSFHIVTNSFGLLNDQNINPNADFRFVPPSPGLGMLWDRTDVFTNGIAKIKAIPSTPTTLTSLVTSNQLALSWPESYIGWELQQQIRPLTNGISVFATNWTTVANSQLTNLVFATITTNNPTAFYRLAHPAF